jgi:preprotein translocase subunit SecE
MADKEIKGKDQKPAKKKDPNKKARRSPIRVVKDTVSEMKKVSWPSRREWINHTAVVTVFCVILMVVVGLIDAGLSALFGLLYS